MFIKPRDQDDRYCTPSPMNPSSMLTASGHDPDVHIHDGLKADRWVLNSHPAQSDGFINLLYCVYSLVQTLHKGSR